MYQSLLKFSLQKVLLYSWVVSYLSSSPQNCRVVAHSVRHTFMYLYALCVILNYVVNHFLYMYLSIVSCWEYIWQIWHLNFPAMGSHLQSFIHKAVSSCLWRDRIIKFWIGNWPSWGNLFLFTVHEKNPHCPLMLHLDLDAPVCPFPCCCLLDFTSGVKQAKVTKDVQKDRTFVYEEHKLKNMD